MWLLVACLLIIIIHITISIIMNIIVIIIIIINVNVNIIIIIIIMMMIIIIISSSTASATHGAAAERCGGPCGAAAGASHEDALRGTEINRSRIGRGIRRQGIGCAPLVRSSYVSTAMPCRQMPLLM